MYLFVSKFRFLEFRFLLSRVAPCLQAGRFLVTPPFLHRFENDTKTTPTQERKAHNLLLLLDQQEVDVYDFHFELHLKHTVLVFLGILELRILHPIKRKEIQMLCCKRK